MKPYRLLTDAYRHEGQFVTIIPSRKPVLVRLGFTRYRDHQVFVDLVWRALENDEPANPAPSTDARHEAGARRLAPR